MTNLQYITSNSLEEGVGASQVLAYVLKLSAKYRIRLISLEKNQPSEEIRSMLYSHRVEWVPLPFGNRGRIAGVLRLVRIAKSAKNIDTHARGEIPFIAAKLAGVSRVVWDCRSLLADQRLAISKRKNYVEYAALRLIEAICARASKRIIVITREVIPLLVERHRVTQNKFEVISTCVDLNHFKPVKKHLVSDYKSKQSLNVKNEYRLLLAGTFGSHYDLDLMGNIVDELRKRCNLFVMVALGKDYEYQNNLQVDEILHVPHKHMPRIISKCDFGMSIWRNDLGVCLKSVAATKNAEFLACGKPIIVNSLQGDIGRLVKSNRVGIATGNSWEISAAAIANQTLELLRDPFLADRCRRFAMTHYSLDAAVNALDGLYSSSFR